MCTLCIKTSVKYIQITHIIIFITDRFGGKTGTFSVCLFFISSLQPKFVILYSTRNKLRSNKLTFMNLENYIHLALYIVTIKVTNASVKFYFPSFSRWRIVHNGICPKQHKN